LLKEKEADIGSLGKQLRITEKERENARSEVLEQQTMLEKVKQLKNREQAETQTKLQFSINECEKLRVSLQKTKEELDSKEAEIGELTHRAESKVKLYKEKYERYEKVIEDFSTELKNIQ